jgi:hypothetical protein
MASPFRVNHSLSWLTVHRRLWLYRHFGEISQARFVVKKLSGSPSENLAKAVRPPQIHLSGAGRKHNSLAKFSGFPNQTVGSGVDEDLNERLIKHEPFAHGSLFRVNRSLSWLTVHRKLWLCRHFKVQVSEANRNDPVGVGTPRNLRQLLTRTIRPRTACRDTGCMRQELSKISFEGWTTRIERRQSHSSLPLPTDNPNSREKQSQRIASAMR